ncbi:Calcineurin subunit B [Hondaea fermentalgiana]|uniref:Calcineurin subunit B n=1 Tax=Hondaea fermentalgiana TaxID=2315210 RepID=A0A2R5GK54_9STRA|nr:Calcineurin subunit B [Hondaea fermentalgiana]|eukprot:GBG29013.1 Calcineurin subunit B [Hondaea fermentalgiana]
MTEAQTEDAAQGAVRRTSIMQLLYEFQSKHQQHVVPEQRHATLDALMDAVDQRRVEEIARKRKEEERAFACDAKVTLQNVQDEMFREEEECQRIAEYFKSTFEEVSRRSKTDSDWKKQQLQNQLLMRQISQSARVATANPAVREEMKNRIRELAEARVTEHHRSAAAKRLRHFKEKHPETETRKVIPPTKIAIARPSVRAGAAKRERARKQALAKLRRKSLDTEATASSSPANPAPGSNSTPAGGPGPQAASKKPAKSLAASSKRSVMGRISDPDEEEELTYADKFYRTQRCLFNAPQMEAAERVFRAIVRDKDESGTASQADELLAADSTTHADDETHALKASQLALQQKGLLARKAMSLSMFQQVLSRVFMNPGESAMIKRIFSVMCGRDPAERREGLTFAKFATYLSTFMLGTTQQKLFLCFEVLDTDRDGFISQHDIFTLLRCNADSALTIDFGVLMAWIVGAHERRTLREEAFAQTQRKRRALMRKALRDFAKQHRRDRQKTRVHRSHGDNDESGNDEEDDVEDVDADDDGEIGDFACIRGSYRNADDRLGDNRLGRSDDPGDDFDKYSSESDDDDDDDISLGSFDSAGDWLNDDGVAEEEMLRNLEEQNAQESQMDFEDFKGLWNAKSGLPELVRLIADCFPQVTAVKKEGIARRGLGPRNGRHAGKSNPEETAGSRTEPASGDKPKNFMANAMSLQKAKKGLLNTLRTRIKVAMVTSHELKCARSMQMATASGTQGEPASAASGADPSTPTPGGKPVPPPKDGEAQDANTPRPGKFLRELGVSVALARAARNSFQRLKPCSLKGTVTRESFVAGLINAQVGFEVQPAAKLLCERLFVAANTSRNGELSFSEFLVSITTALQGTRRERARLTLNALLSPEREKDFVEAHELETLVNAGLDVIDPVLANYLLDVVVTRVSRGDRGVILFKDVLVFGEDVRQQKEDLAAQALAASRIGPAMSRRSIISGGGGDDDRDSVVSTVILSLGGNRRTDRKLRSMSSCSTSSQAIRSHRRGNRRGLSVDLHIDPRSVEQRMGDFELHSLKEQQIALRQSPDVDYVFIHKLVEAFLPTATRA